MLQLYNEKPVLISMKQNKSVFSVDFVMLNEIKNVPV